MSIKEKIKKFSDKLGPDFWPFNTNDATAYLRGNIRGDKQAGKIVMDHLENLRTAGRPINYLDVAGKARFKDGVVTHNYSFSKSRGLRIGTTDRTFFVGDLMSGNSFDQFIEKLKNQNVKLDFVSFNSFGGLQDFMSDKLSRKLNISKLKAEQILLVIYRNRLKKLTAAMSGDCLLYIGTNTVLAGHFKKREDYINFMNDFYTKLGFEIVYINNNFGRCLLRIKK